MLWIAFFLGGTILTKLPEVVCKHCGELKLPKQRCSVCFPYRPKTDPVLESTRELIKARKGRKKLAWQDWKKEYPKAYELSRAKHREWSNHSKLMQRAKQVARYRQALFRVLSLFEKDAQGDHQIYEDRLPEMRRVLNMIEVFLLQEKRLSTRYRLFPEDLELQKESWNFFS